MANNLQKSYLFVALTLFGCSANAAGWQTIGAGNTTCEHWKQANAMHEVEVLSWMAGFSSAANIERASEGRPEFRLELLTYEYLRQEIGSTCTHLKNKNEKMYSILFRLLTQFPTVSKWAISRLVCTLHYDFEYWLGCSCFVWARRAYRKCFDVACYLLGPPLAAITARGKGPANASRYSSGNTRWDRDSLGYIYLRNWASAWSLGRWPAFANVLARFSRVFHRLQHQCFFHRPHPKPWSPETDCLHLFNGTWTHWFLSPK